MNKTFQNWIMLIVLSIIWGASFILMKLGMETTDGDQIFSSSQVATLRMAIAAIVLIPFSLKALPLLRERGLFLKLIAVGMFGNFFPAFLFTYAETGISSGYTGMLNSFTPIFALLISAFIFREKFTKKQIIGTVIGVIGIVSLSVAGGISFDSSLKYVLAVIVATVCYAISLNVIKHMLKGVPSVKITSLALLMTLSPSVVLFFTTGTYDVIMNNEFSSQGLFYISILSIVGTAFALFIFNILISNSSIVFASSVTYLIPIVAVVIGVFFKESLNAYQLIGVFIVLTGILVANVKSKKNMEVDE